MVAARLADGRLHLQQGPIDLLIAIDATASEQRLAERQVLGAFDGLLQALVDELPELRRPCGEAGPTAIGPVARRMQQASQSLVRHTRFVTPMAAVAGSVADELLAALVANRAIDRAAVNNGGDIAVHLAPGMSYRIGLVANLEGGQCTGHATLASEGPSRGIATSGWRGRSHSMGIADAVTVLAPCAATADVAATLIANAIDIDAPATIERLPACELDPDSDLGCYAVTVRVGRLSTAQRDTALLHGSRLATDLLNAGAINAAWLFLQGAHRVVGPSSASPVGVIGLDDSQALAQHRATASSG